MAETGLTFWFEFGSTYSYLSAMRIEAAAEAARVRVAWRPFLLGPIFTAQGWSTSPFNIFEAKGRYMWRDMERRAALHGLVFQRPATFPQNGLHAARIAHVLLPGESGRRFVRAVFEAEFALGRDIGDRECIEEIAHRCGASDADIAASISAQGKQDLRAATDEAAALGIFGAPTFMVGDEMYWGDDRLEEALALAARNQQEQA